MEKLDTGRVLLRGLVVKCVLSCLQAVDATDDAEEAGQVHVKNPSQASLATSTSGEVLHLRLPIYC